MLLTPVLVTPDVAVGVCFWSEIIILAPFRAIWERVFEFFQKVSSWLRRSHS